MYLQLTYGFQKKLNIVRFIKLKTRFQFNAFLVLLKPIFQEYVFIIHTQLYGHLRTILIKCMVHKLTDCPNNYQTSLISPN